MVNAKFAKKLNHALHRMTRPVRGIWPRFPDALLGMGCVAVVGLAGLTYCTPLAKMAGEIVVGNRYAALAEGLLNPFRTPHLLLNSGLPVYDLRIPRQQYALIMDSVEQAKKRGWMGEDIKAWGKAKFIHRGREYDVQVRVRGDLPNHWSGPKKSWAIKFVREKIDDNGRVLDEAIFFDDGGPGGLSKRRINLIIPQDREYAVAPWINELMREKGLVVPEDQYVVLRINGVLQGLYYEVEQLDKPMLAAQRRPETTIFGLNDRAMHFEQYTKYGAPQASDTKYDVGSLRRDVDPVDDLGIRAVQVLIDHCQHPSAQSFRRVRAVLDWEKFLRFRALTTLLCTNHVRFGSDNLKLFFDASRGLLEPVPWDAHLVRMPNEPGTVDFWNCHGADEIERSILTDPQTRLQRNKILWEMVGDDGETLMAKYNVLHERLRPLAWADVLNTPIQGHKMDLLKEDLEHNIHRVQRVLSVSNASFTYRLLAADRAALEIATANFSGVDLSAAHLTDKAVLQGTYRLYEDANDNGELDPGDPLVQEATASQGKISLTLKRCVLPGVQYKGSYFDTRYWEYFDTLAGRARWFLVGKLAATKRHPLDWTPPNIQVAAANAVTQQPIPAALVSAPEAAPDNSIGIVAYDASDFFDPLAAEQGLAEFLKTHPQFVASPQRPGAAELRGRVTISKTTIVPKSVLLVLCPGADITLSPGVSVVCYGGLRAVGTADQWIRLHDNGKGGPWGAFAVVRPPQKVEMEYLEAQGGGQAQVNATLFTGGMAVYNGDLRLEHCRIIKQQSEDGFNLKNGHIYMSDCLFEGNAGDAFDFDFVTGEVHNCRFAHNANDGLDLSGSTVLVVNNRFEYNGDKGLSVGENSHPIVLNGLFRGNNIGVSCKDLSHPRLAYCTFVENTLAIEGKRKKEMFGGGSGQFVQCVFSGNKTFMEEDYFSRGRVLLQHSLCDGPVRFATCRTLPIQFQAPAAGDYRLAAAEVLADEAWTAVPVEWAKVERLPATPQQPGILSIVTP